MTLDIRWSLALTLSLAIVACKTDDDATDTDETDTTTDATDDTDDTVTDDTDDSDVVVSNCTVTPPATWAAPDWAANTTEALAVRARLDALVGGMRTAEQGTSTVDELSDLTTPYADGEPSIEDLTHAGYAGVIDDVFAEFLEITAAGAQDLVDGDGNWDPGEAGGIFEASFRGINEGGIEVRQIVDKGLFGGGALYPYALSLTEGTITPATIDAIAAVWGTNETADPEGSLTDSANYTTAMGYGDEIVTALIAAKAYAADSECTAERDEALVTAFRTWELGLAARYVHYANNASAKFATPSGDADLAGGLHELAEGIGLVAGFRGMPSPTTGPLAGAGRVITDADLDVILEAVGFDFADLGASTTGDYVADSSGFATGVTAVETKMKAVYGVSDADIAAWRLPAED